MKPSPWTPSADISPCGTFRFRLRRERPLKIYGGRVLAVTMLNPSKADGTVDDPTIRRLLFFADRERCDVLDVTNLWPFRATDPDELVSAAARGIRVDGGHLQEHIAPISASAFETRVRGGIWVVAWGAGAERISGSARLVQDVLASVPADAHCFGVTKGGHPKHPLYLPNTATLTRFVLGEASHG